MKSSQRKKPRWSDEEKQTLTEMYPRSPKYLILAALPQRRWEQILDQASRMGITKPKPDRLLRTEVLRRKRADMAQRRSDPTKGRLIRERQRTRYNRDPIVREKAHHQSKALRERRFFYTRSRRYKTVSAKDLWSLWKRQRGRCAITGRRLNREAHLDHDLAIVRGGAAIIANLQWVCPEVNWAKRHLSTEEFVALCEETILWRKHQHALILRAAA